MAVVTQPPAQRAALEQGGTSEDERPPRAGHGADGGLARAGRARSA